MNKILYLVLTAAIACQVSAEDDYSKHSSNKDSSKVLVKIDNDSNYKRSSDKVVVKLSSPNKQDYYDRESSNEENPSIKTRYEAERHQEDEYTYDYPKDQQHSDENRYVFKQEEEGKIEKIPQPLYVNVNLKKNEQTYISEPKKINVNVKINNEKQEDQQIDVSRLLTNYGEKPKKVLVNVKIRKEDDGYYDQRRFDEPKKFNINVKIRKVEEPSVYEQKKESETILDKLYRVSKKYTGL